MEPTGVSIFECKNGLKVVYGITQTPQNNFGYLEVIRPDNLPPARLVLSSWELAEKIGKMLVEDFNK